MKLDSHQHFWHYSRDEYSWITADMAQLRRDFLPDELERERSAAGFVGSIAVQARQSLEETKWLLELADENERVMGVVGWVDLCSPALPAQLEAFASHAKLRGVRHVIQGEPDDGFALRDDFVRGIGELERYGLTYDVLIYPRHLPVACELVARFPNQPFVLDHMAKPPIRDGVLEPWASGIRALAAFPNVYCKASGLVTEADWTGWTAEGIRPYLDVAFDAFGPRRMMIGSDWPVCTLAGSYQQVMGLVASYIQTLSQSEQRAVLGETAQSFYGVTQ